MAPGASRWDNGASDGDDARVKRQKTSGADLDAKKNPYLAHMYESEQHRPATTGPAALAQWKRHSSTAGMARQAEDGPQNPLTGRPLSQRYFDILHTRRDLPVHAQRYVWFPSVAQS